MHVKMCLSSYQLKLSKKDVCLFLFKMISPFLLNFSPFIHCLSFKNLSLSPLLLVSQDYSNGFLQVEVCVFVFDIMFFNGEQYVSFTQFFKIFLCIPPSKLYVSHKFLSVQCRLLALPLRERRRRKPHLSLFSP